MRHSALGLVEVRGYLGAVAAADAALKAASVACIGVEIIKGGLVTVKLSGDVGAVQAAVEAGAEAATQLDVLVTRHVIARLHEETAAMVANPVDTDGSQKHQEDAAKVSPGDHAGSSITEEVSATSAAVESDAAGASVETAAKKAVEATKAKVEQAAVSKKPAVAEDSQANTAELASAAAIKEADEVKPASAQTDAVPAVNIAATVEKPTGAQKNQNNSNNSHVKPAPAAKRTKNKKKASS
ncbi:MAG: BMC domain-containing protein [Bacillota bacterium]